MSIFGALQTIKKSTSIPKLPGVPVFKFSELKNKDEIGRGGFAAVFTAESPINKEKIVVKKFFDECDDDDKTRRKLVKEAKLLHTLDHPNLVRLKGLCSDQNAILLEYVCFNLKPFGLDKTVTCLKDLLQYFDKIHCAQISSKVFYYAATDIAKGLQYLHENGVAHRDLKPANVLVSNQHYCNLENTAEIEEVSHRIPLTCKLADFGESRSEDIHTNTVILTRTKHVDRGTPVFMAPEIFSKGVMRLNAASQEDLKKADIWAYGMVVFSIINPGLRHPFELNMQNSSSDKFSTPLQLLQTFFEEKVKPIMQGKYSRNHEREWHGLVNIYSACTDFNTSKRPQIGDIIELLSEYDHQQSILSPVPEKEEFHLKVNQATVLNNVNEIAAAVYPSQIDVSNMLYNDATNACVFLCLNVAHKLLADDENNTLCDWQQIAYMVEDIIENFPIQINPLRNIRKCYAVLEAYRLLRNAELLPLDYEFSEELPFSFGVFTEHGKSALFEAIAKLQENKTKAALYTCEPYTILIGSRWNNIFVVDTHVVPSLAGGKDTAIIKLFKNSITISAAQATCDWLWRRLSVSGVGLDSPQSLSVMSQASSEKEANSLMRINTNTCQWEKERAVAQESSCGEPRRKKANIKVCEQRLDSVTSELLSSQILNNRKSEEKMRSAFIDDEESEDSEDEDKIPVISDYMTAKQSATIVIEDSADSKLEDEIPRIVDIIEKQLPCQKYNGNDSLPVFEWTSKLKSPMDVVTILLQPVQEDLLCKVAPQSISHNVCFLLKSSLLKSENDWKSDDMGAWKNNGVQYHKFFLNEDGELHHLGKNEGGDNGEEGTTYNIKRVYFKNKQSTDLKKCVTFIEENSDLMFIQYLFDGKEHEVQPAAHGNCTRINSPVYVRTKESTVKSLQTIAQKHTPKEAYHFAHKKNGGNLHAESLSDLPRNRAQAKYQRRGHTNKSNFDGTDSLVILLEQCKRQQLQRDEQPFIREVVGAPELRCILGYDWQLEDMVTFCTNPAKNAIFGVDPTFNLGKFNVTVSCYSNLKVVDRVTGVHPTMIGPLLLSQTKTFDSYNTFFSKIVSLNKETRNILAFGTDGEEELYRAMRYCFPKAIHLRCFSHFKDNCKEQLRSSNIPDAEQKELLYDVFGRRNGDVWEEGLVDRETEEELREKLASFKVKWDGIEKKFLQHEESPKFYDYITSKIPMIVQCMLKKVRRNAGLGDPPSPYFNNCPESANAVIKGAVNFKVSEMSEFCRSMSMLALQQKEDVESSVFNTGPYKLCPEFSSFQVPENRWFQKTMKQRQAHLRKFREEKMEELENTLIEAIGPSSAKDDPPSSCSMKLSVNLVSDNITSAPTEVLKSIHEKAEALLNSPQAIVSAPGCTEQMAYMVKSDTAEKPHFVSIAKNGKVTCDSCPGWKSLKLCAHAVAAAEKSGKLSQYVNWLKEKGPCRMNITSYVTFDSSQATGKKGNKPSTARRKGGRSGKKPPATKIIDRPDPTFQDRTSTVVPTTALGAPLTNQVNSSMAATTPGSPQFFQHQSARETAPATSIPFRPDHNRQSHNMQQFNLNPTNVVCPVQPSRTNLSSASVPTVNTSISFNPQSTIFTISLLQCCPSGVRSCFGCFQNLKPGGRIADPPYDLVVISRMPRTFNSRSTGELMAREGNVYFHLNANCIRQRQPYYVYDPRTTVISPYISNYLRAEHHQMLQTFIQTF